MNIFIVGSNGYIAKRLNNKITGHTSKLISSNPKSDEYYLDLAKPELFNYEIINPGDNIALLASISSPDICNNNFEYAYNINVKGTEYFIEKCLERQGKVLFFSSDTVYGAKKDTVFDENSDCNPIGKYAEMKHIIECKFVGQPGFKVFRLSYVFSKSDKFTRYLLNCRDNNLEAEIFHPFYRKAVYIDDLVCAIENIFNEWDEWNQSVFNICGTELLSRVDISKIFTNYIDSSLRIKIVNPNEDFFKARPQVIDMDSLYFSNLIKRKPTSLKDAMIKELL